jgi:hypothetical protein
VSENLRNVLSALLYQTGTQSEHYMLVLATNRPEDLDRAITDRIDEALHFDLPRLEVRCCAHPLPTPPLLSRPSLPRCLVCRPLPQARSCAHVIPRRLARARALSRALTLSTSCYFHRSESECCASTSSSTF